MAFGIGEAIAAGLKVLDKFVPDPAEKAKAEAELRASLMQWDKNQTEINTAEATNQNLFVSGWRPFIGWTCGAALAYQYVGVPLITWVTSWVGLAMPEMPKLDENLWQLVTGMLGMAGLRTFDKMKRIARN